MLGFSEALKSVFVPELLQNPFAVHLVSKKLNTTNILELSSGLWDIFNLPHTSEVSAASVLTGYGGLSRWLFTVVTLWSPGPRPQRVHAPSAETCWQMPDYGQFWLNTAIETFSKNNQAYFHGAVAFVKLLWHTLCHQTSISLEESIATSKIFNQQCSESRRRADQAADKVVGMCPHVQVMGDKGPDGRGAALHEKGFGP